MDPKLLLLILLLAGMVVLLLLAFSGPSTSKAQSRRLSAAIARHAPSANAGLDARMRKAIATVRQDKGSFASLIPNPENLTNRLHMTGKPWTLNQYIMACVALMLAIILLGLTRGWPLPLTLLVGVAGGFGLPYKYLGMLISKRLRQFIASFPDALELMVRGLRSGLPIAETLSVVATEVDGPVGEEFRLVGERIKIGKTMDQALQETATRLDTPEFQFFCITLNIQRETGGNLAETLANLANVLRQRGQMKLKINAMSSEAKASAWILGCLPFLVFAIISWMNFEYMAPFFTPDPEGIFGFSLMQIIGIGGMCWMSIGVFIMAQMINFEI
ncbi:MAG: type II secretion system F family protein [Sphingobium sp.]|nr:type II secretion system F family protein [Sphingobium sp.]